MLVPIGFIFCCQALSAKASFYFLMNNPSTALVMLFESKQGRRSTKSHQSPQALGVTSCDFVDGLAAGSLTTRAKYEPSKRATESMFCRPLRGLNHLLSTVIHGPTARGYLMPPATQAER